MKSVTSISKRVFTTALLGSALLGTTMVHAEDALEHIMKSKTIKIAIPTDYPPYGSIGTDMQPRGLDIDMANLIAKSLGAKAELIPVISANRVPYLQTGKADLVVSTLGKTEERAKVIDFTSAYSPYYQAIFAPKNIEIKKWSDLVGKSVAVVRGGMEDQVLATVVPPGVDVKRFEDNNATVTAFVTGRTQVLAASTVVAADIMKNKPDLNAEFKLLLKNSPNYIGVAKGQDALKNKVNDIIAKAKADGELDALSKKWLNSPAGNLPE